MYKCMCDYKILFFKLAVRNAINLKGQGTRYRRRCALRLEGKAIGLYVGVSCFRLKGRSTFLRLQFKFVKVFQLSVCSEIRPSCPISLKWSSTIVVQCFLGKEFILIV